MIPIATPPSAPREATCYDSTGSLCTGAQSTAKGSEKNTSQNLNLAQNFRESQRFKNADFIIKNSE